MPFFRDELPNLDPAVEVQFYALWLDSVDRGCQRNYPDFVAGLMALHGLTADALMWCGDNADSIEHAPQYTEIRELRRELRLEHQFA